MEPRSRWMEPRSERSAPRCRRPRNGACSLAPDDGSLVKAGISSAPRGAPSLRRCLESPGRQPPPPGEEGEGFRETLLLHFTDPEANETLRRLGRLVFGMSLDSAPSWPHHPEGETRAELSAALADLRHLEGFLAAVGREHEVSSLSEAEDALSILAGELAGEV